MDCGPMYMHIVATYYGRSISLQFLRARTQKGKEGVNLLRISEAAEAIVFRTQAMIKSEKLIGMKSRCDEVKTEFTITFFINGYPLPKQYNIEELKYFLEK